MLSKTFVYNNMEVKGKAFKEYEINATFLNRLGTQSIIIKGWTISLIAALALLTAKTEGSRVLFLFGVIIIFWLVESIYRHVMNIVKSRQEILESYLNDELDYSPKTPYLFNELKSAFRFSGVLKASIDARVFPIYALLLFTLVIYTML